MDSLKLEQKKAIGHGPSHWKHKVRQRKEERVQSECLFILHHCSVVGYRCLSANNAFSGLGQSQFGTRCCQVPSQDWSSYLSYILQVAPAPGPLQRHAPLFAIQPCNQPKLSVSLIDLYLGALLDIPQVPHPSKCQKSSKTASNVPNNDKKIMHIASAQIRTEVSSDC